MLLQGRSLGIGVLVAAGGGGVPCDGKESRDSAIETGFLTVDKCGCIL